MLYWTMSGQRLDFQVYSLSNDLRFGQDLYELWTATGQTLYFACHWTGIWQSYDRVWTKIGFYVQTLSNHLSLRSTIRVLIARSFQGTFAVLQLLQLYSYHLITVLVPMIHYESKNWCSARVGLGSVNFVISGPHLALGAIFFCWYWWGRDLGQDHQEPCTQRDRSRVQVWSHLFAWVNDEIDREFGWEGSHILISCQLCSEMRRKKGWSVTMHVLSIVQKESFRPAISKFYLIPICNIAYKFD